MAASGRSAVRARSPASTAAEAPCSTFSAASTSSRPARTRSSFCGGSRTATAALSTTALGAAGPTAGRSTSTSRSCTDSTADCGPRYGRCRSTRKYSMRFGRERFDAPGVRALALAQQAELRALDGRGDIGPTRIAQMFEPPDGVFLVGREHGRAVVCGGIARFDETRGELKRMYVVPEARGRGHGRAILEALEEEARTLGYEALVLETGYQQVPAVGLYESSGYEPIPCYGSYGEQAISRCYEKRL